MSGLNASQLPAALAGALPAAASAVLPAIQAAAARTGVDFQALFHTARLESGFRTDARAPTSSATGLFQFIDSSWLSVLARHGARHGLNPASRAEAMALRLDPAASSLMAAEHMADNAALLEQRLGRPAGPVDLYLAHFLGAGGAQRFLSQMADTPGMPAAHLLPAAAKANRAIFHSASGPRSLAQVHDLLARRLGLGDAATPGAPAGPRHFAAAAPAPPGAAPAPMAATAEAPALPVQAHAAARLAYLLLAEMGA